MAVVYRAFQPSMDREVAVKLILPEIATEDSDFRERFQREARIVAKLEHPHILPVYDFGQTTETKQHYLVMRLLENGDLRDYTLRTKIGVEEATRIITQIASALNHAHRAGIIHRDLKPQNVLLDNNNNCYLTDFGIAKSLGNTKEMTATGTIMGTPSYMAPEQWRSETVTAQTDIYALGVIAYSLYTGQLPFEADAPFSLMYLHLDEMPIPLEFKNADLPANLSPIVLRAMAKKPEDRFATAEQFAEALNWALKNRDDYYVDVHSTQLKGDKFSTLASGPDDMRTFVGGTQKTQLEAEATVQLNKSKTASTQAEASTPPASSRPWSLILAGLFVLIGLGAGAFLALGNGGEEATDPTNAPTEVAQEASPSQTATEAPSNTPAATDTPSHTPTPSQTPSDTPSPTSTATITNTPTPSVAVVQVIVGRGLIYAEADTRSDELTVAPEGSQMEILGRTPDDNWYLVSFGGETGWIFAQQVRAAGPVGEVEVILSPTPTPTDTPSQTPSPTITPSPTATATYTPSLTITPSFTPSFTPSPTAQIATSVPCVVTAQSGEVNLRDFPSTGAESQVINQIFGGDSLTVTAQTFDGWYLSEQGWVFGSVVSLSSEFVCGSLPLLEPASNDPDFQNAPVLCEVLSSEAMLYQGNSTATTPLTLIPRSETLGVTAVSRGEDGQDWYRVRYENPSAIRFEGWLSSASAGPVAGSCPSAPPGVSLFGNPYSNPLQLETLPSFADNFQDAGGGWGMLVPGTDLQIQDGQLLLVLRPRESNSLIAGNEALGGLISDGFISLRLSVPPQSGESYFVETIVRGFYSVRISETGNVAVAAEANPSLIFGSTPDGVANLNAGVTLGLAMEGETLRVFINGVEILSVRDNSRSEGILLRFRVSNRSQNENLTLIVDDFAYWDFAN
jgi:serine/threonine protein kinase